MHGVCVVAFFLQGRGEDDGSHVPLPWKRFREDKSAPESPVYEAAPRHVIPRGEHNELLGYKGIVYMVFQQNGI